MNRQELNNYITQIQSEVERLSKELTVLSYTDFTLYPENYEKFSTDTALLGERITCRLRHLVYDMTRISKAEYIASAGEAHGIEIKYEDGVFEITLPYLLPKRNKRNGSEFLIDPIFFAMSAYKRTYSFPLFKECTICFTHVYDESLRKSRVRDYDNMELKQVLDAISAFVLTDDNGRLCDAYHTTEIGTASCTRITIMSKDHFPNWLEARKNYPKTISDF